MRIFPRYSWNDVRHLDETVKVFTEEIDRNKKTSRSNATVVCRARQRSAVTETPILQRSATVKRATSKPPHRMTRCYTDTRCRSPINGLAGLHRRPLPGAPATGPVSRRRPFGSGSVQVTRAENCVQGGGGAAVEPDGWRSPALREPIDHRLDSASFMSSRRTVLCGAAGWTASQGGIPGAHSAATAIH